MAARRWRRSRMVSSRISWSATLHLADGETGLGVADDARAALKREIPALVLTGDTSPAAQAAARVAGIGLLLKPVDPEELLDRIRALLA